MPLIYQSNPDRFHAMFEREAPAESAPLEAAALIADPRREPAVRQLTGRRIQVDMDRRGHFLAEFKINGRRVQAMVDTGATLVAMNRSTASRIGIDMTNADFRYEVNTANGSARAASTRIASLQIGRIVVEDVEAVVLEDTSLNNTLIGMSFLKRLGRFRIEHGTLILEQ